MRARHSKNPRGASMTYQPAPARYDTMTYRRLGRSGLKLSGSLARALAQFRRRLGVREHARHVPHRVRSRHHAFRPRQQLRPAAGLGGGEFRRASSKADFHGLRDELDRLHQGRLQHVARPLRRMGQPQISARQPRPEPEADGARLRRHLLFAPRRSRHAARGDDGRARHRRAAGQGALCRHLVLQLRADGARPRRSCASSARPASSISRAIRC